MASRMSRVWRRTLRFLVWTTRNGLRLAVGAPVLLALLWGFASWRNTYDRSGEIIVERGGPSAPVRLLRDAHGTPYVIAESLDDALWGQGYALAQDRLWDLELKRIAMNAQLSSIFGESMLASDRAILILGFRRLGAQRLERLDPVERAHIEAFVAGVNAYIGEGEDWPPLEFFIARQTLDAAAAERLSPQPWTAVDVLALFYATAYSFAAPNVETEILTQALIEALGPERAAAITPIARNPDEPIEAQNNAGLPLSADALAGWTPLGLRLDQSLFASPAPASGSNNWAISAERTSSGAAVLVNDPHLDIRTLPGPWHPIGLITPERSIVGAHIGLPGVIIGRSGPVAFGVTIGYGDVIDLYVETLDPSNPDRYLRADGVFDSFNIEIHFVDVADPAAEGGVRREMIRVRRTKSGRIVVAAGPQLSAPGKALSMRWSVAEPAALEDPKLGLFDLLTAQDVDEGVAAAAELDVASLNFVFADIAGRVAYRAAGRLPRRVAPAFSPKLSAYAATDWPAMLSAHERPGVVDPPRLWAGTANHMTASAMLGGRYATSSAASYRYRRMIELFDRPGPISADDAWRAQFDVLNLFARDVAPLMARALSQHAETAAFGVRLDAWDHRDAAERAEPLIFQALVIELADLAYGRLVDEPLLSRLLRRKPYWHERLRDALLRPGENGLFADRADRDALIVEAAKRAEAKLLRDYGPDPARWTWGAAHTLEMVGPLQLKGALGMLLGARSIPLAGSGETLNRSGFSYRIDGPDRFAGSSVVSFRMMVDFARPDRIRIHHPGGPTGRTFHPHLANGLAGADDAGSERWLWFTRDAVEAAAVAELRLYSQVRAQPKSK